MNKQPKPDVVLQVGSVVKLKSGGPNMTVTGADTHRALLTVVWADVQGRVAKAELPVLSLTIVKA